MSPGDAPDRKQQQYNGGQRGNKELTLQFFQHRKVCSPVKESSGSVAPLITVSPYCGKISRLRSVVFDLCAQAPDVYIYGFGFTGEVFAPDSHQDIITGHGLAGIFHEEFHKKVSELCKPDSYYEIVYLKGSEEYRTGLKIDYIQSQIDELYKEVLNNGLKS